jgi:flagellar hook-length control protein FliK
MADRNEALQVGFSSAKDLQVSQSARSPKPRFSNENVVNKQEFAKTYARSLRKQNQAAENEAGGHKQGKQDAAKTDRAKPVKSHSLDASHRSKLHPKSTETTAAKNGRNLPKNLNDDSALPETTVTHEGAALRYRQETSHQGYETAEYGIAGSAFGLDNEAGNHEFNLDDNQTRVSGHLEPNLNGFDSMAATVSGFEQGAGATNAVALSQQESMRREGLQPVYAQPQTLASSALPPGQAAQSHLSSQSGSAISFDSSESLDAEQNLQSAAKSSPSDVLLRVAAEENQIRAPVINAPRPANELNKSNLSTAELFANLNSGQSEQQTDGDSQQISRQESALFKDRLASLAQHNTTQTAGNDLNKLMAQHTTQLPQALDEASSDFNNANAHAIKDPSISPRMSGSPLHMLSPMLQMSSPLEHKGWSNEVGQRVMWMVNKDLQQARLQLNPKHLGPIEIKISMTADQQVNVNFLTHSTTVKEALDQALPRLRDVFDQSGLNLNDVNIQHESPKQHREHHHTAGQRSISEVDLAENMHEEVPVAQIFQNQTLSSNIVDYFA